MPVHPRLSRAKPGACIGAAHVLLSYHHLGLVFEAEGWDLKLKFADG